jgi:hypothetical protein
MLLCATSEPNLNNHCEVQDADVVEAPGPNSIWKSALKYFPQRAISLPIKVFNEVLHMLYFPPLW